MHYFQPEQQLQARRLFGPLLRYGTLRSCLLRPAHWDGIRKPVANRLRPSTGSFDQT